MLARFAAFGLRRCGIVATAQRGGTSETGPRPPPPSPRRQRAAKAENTNSLARRISSAATASFNSTIINQTF